MAREYVLIATGHNNAAGFVRFKVTPWLPRVLPGIQRLSMSRKATEDGKRSAPLFWSPKVPNAIKVDALTKCGLTSVLYANVTIRLPSNKDRTVWANYNGVAYYDESDEFERSGSGFSILVFDLTAI